jgi:AcrR family transcriptional regulator
MSGDEPNAKRQKQHSERLEKILEASARLFAAKGFHRTTTKEIAEAANVAEGTLYNYFENKNELLLEILNHLIEAQDFRSQLEGSILHDPRQFFIDMFESQKVDSEKHSVMQKAILSEILADVDLRKQYYSQLVVPALTMLEKHLQMRIMLGQISSLDTPLAARFIVSLWTGIFILQLLGDPELESDWDAFAQQSTAILFNGIERDRKQLS